MLRFCRLTSHKNNLIIDDFSIDDSSDEFFLHRTSVAELLTYPIGVIGAIRTTIGTIRVIGNR